MIQNISIKHKTSVSILTLCEWAGVSRSGYYAWKKALVNRVRFEEQDYQDYLLINNIFESHNRKSGWRTIRMILENEKGIVMNHKKIQRLMNKFRLYTKIRRANPYKHMMKATQEHKTAPNLLNRKFDVDVPQTVLLTDITYLYYNKGQKAYLSAVKDMATNEILAYVVSSSLKMDFVFRTLDRLKESVDNNFHPEIILHSDQGFHYTHPKFQHSLVLSGITQSMSRKGNCIDNAPMESFFGHMKDFMDYKDATSLEELKLIVAEYMNFYNYERYQWNLKKMTPANYRNHLLAA